MTAAAAATMMTMEVKSLVELLLLLGKDFLNFSRLREKTNGFCSSLDLTTLVFSFKVGVSPSMYFRPSLENHSKCLIGNFPPIFGLLKVTW